MLVLLAGLSAVPQNPTIQAQRRIALPLSRDQVAFAFKVQDPKVDIEAECKRLARDSTDDRQFALYLMARWQHRKYELSAPIGSSKESFLRKSVIAAYHDSMRAFPRGTYLSDARFYKAIAYLELGDLNGARAALRDLDPRIDPTLEIDDIVWTPSREFSVRRSFPADTARKELASAIEARSADQFPDVRVEAVARQIRLWTRYSSARAQ